MLNRIHDAADDAGERLQKIILELESDNATLPRSVVISLYAAGEHLAKLHTACMLADRKAPADVDEAMSEATRRALSGRRRRR